MEFQHVIAWGTFLAIILAMLAVDLLVLHRKPHQIKLKEALLGASIPVAAALLFMGALYWAYSTHFLHLGIVDPKYIGTPSEKFFPTTGGEASLMFLTGYLVELSLSADNVFLFVVLMNFFKVPTKLQHRVLFWGVLGALVMRAIMILVGTALLSRFHWIIYIFGAFLVFTAIKMLFSGDEESDPSQSLAVRVVKKSMPFHDGYVGQNFFAKVNGKTVATTLFLVLICIEFTDLVFALDSIPAIFGITLDSYIVFTSNVFAILGLRSMYFLLAGVMDKFHFLKYGLAVVLGFVGVKMLLPAIGHLFHQEWEINKYVSLGIIVMSLVASIVASLLFPRKTRTHNPLEEDAPPVSPPPNATASGATV